MLIHDLCRTFPGTRPSQFLRGTVADFQFDLAVAVTAWQRERQEDSNDNAVYW